MIPFSSRGRFQRIRGIALAGFRKTALYSRQFSRGRLLLQDIIPLCKSLVNGTPHGPNPAGLAQEMAETELPEREEFGILNKKERDAIFRQPFSLGDAVKEIELKREEETWDSIILPAACLRRNSPRSVCACKSTSKHILKSRLSAAVSQITGWRRIPSGSLRGLCGTPGNGCRCPMCFSRATR